MTGPRIIVICHRRPPEPPGLLELQAQLAEERLPVEPEFIRAERVRFPPAVTQVVPWTPAARPAQPASSYG